MWKSLDYLQAYAVLLSICLYFTFAEKCQFPKEWKGRWFQSQLGQVMIRPNRISRKGTCRQHQRDYFLLENKEDNCFQCLLMMKRHKNIIQYKESYCVPQDTLKNICSQIQVEGILFTLVREPSLSTKCPFEDAYYFKYNDNNAGYCDNALSYMKPCVGHEQYQLHFKHCKQYAFMNNVDVGYECIASWKDGSDMYLYAKMSGTSIQTKDDSYRCFKYKLYGAEIHMSMSFDATCRGLRSAEAGPLVMEFSKDLYWPQPMCKFPDWLRYIDWRDLEGKHVFRLESRAQVLNEAFRKNANAQQSQLRAEFRCVKIVKEDKDTVTIMTHATHNCVTKYQCIKLRRHADNVAEISFGRFLEYDSEDLCVSVEEYTDVKLITHDVLPNRRQCPTPGRYDISEPLLHCMQDFSLGCVNDYTMAVVARDATCGMSLEIECVTFWNEGEKTYIIGKEPGKNNTLYNCFSFRHRVNGMEFSTEKTFSKGLPPLFPRALKFTIQGKRVKCTEQIYRPEIIWEPQINGINFQPLKTTTSTTTTTTQPTTPSTTTVFQYPEIFLPFTPRQYPRPHAVSTEPSTIKHIIIDGYLDKTDHPGSRGVNSNDRDGSSSSSNKGSNIKVTDRERERVEEEKEEAERRREERRRNKQLKQSNIEVVYNRVNKDREDEYMTLQTSLPNNEKGQGHDQGQSEGQEQLNEETKSLAIVFVANACVVLISVMISIL